MCRRRSAHHLYKASGTSTSAAAMQSTFQKKSYDKSYPTELQSLPFYSLQTTALPAYLLAISALSGTVLWTLIGINSDLIKFYTAADSEASRDMNAEGRETITLRTGECDANVFELQKTNSDWDREDGRSKPSRPSRLTRSLWRGVVITHDHIGIPQGIKMKVVLIPVIPDAQSVYKVPYSLRSSVLPVGISRKRRGSDNGGNEGQDSVLLVEGDRQVKRNEQFFSKSRGPYCQWSTQ
ncbi:hypothetical protein IW261DRAFT_1598636 [Armillaria novae-zelandiae]|uniref:Uncharacterized protein n=1 Tax=Armillaria novae-zelandiae TaxID=153914 RepID=A0AA39U0X5_9AGAR|nr:hypothetical protein IW261DRAFT_1598636 [Armillaria novae-zelandiae]